MDAKEIREYCLSFFGAEEFCPFEEDIVIFRHGGSGKWFALMTVLDGKLCVNVKNDPEDSAYLRGAFEGVKPAWHMNKIHWNTAVVDDVPEEVLKKMISSSFELTLKKAKKGNVKV